MTGAKSIELPFLFLHCNFFLGTVTLCHCKEFQDMVYLWFSLGGGWITCWRTLGATQLQKSQTSDKTRHLIAHLRSSSWLTAATLGHVKWQQTSTFKLCATPCFPPSTESETIRDNYLSLMPVFDGSYTESLRSRLCWALESSLS